MSATTRLEIQNRTPFPLTWAHLARPDETPGRAPENLLDATVPPHRGRVVGDVAAGRVRLVLGFHRDEGTARAESGAHLLGDGEAWSACVEYDDERDAFGVRWLDARVPEGERRGDRPAAGPYRWQGRRGEPRYKRPEAAQRGPR